MNDLKQNDECMELKNIKYKTMLANGKPLIETKSQDNLSSLDIFLENEKKNNANENWGKLNKTIQIKKIIDFVEKYSEENQFSPEEKNELSLFLKDAIDKKKLKKVKDVIYDKTNEQIISIPGLQFNKQNKHFTIRNLDKRQSTLKSLPKKLNATFKNKQNLSIEKSIDEKSIGENE
jgi:hypothetical protein